MAFLFFSAANPALISLIRLTSARIARVSFQLSCSSGLTNTAAGGLGVRLLTGSYNGQTITIWGVLLVSAILAAILVIAVGLAERLVLRNMGQAPA